MAALTTRMDQRKGLFLFPILVGTTLSSHDLVLDPTDYNLPYSIPIPGFTLDEADILVKNHFQNGNQLLKDNQFRRLLAMVGGVGRPLERLKLILDGYQQPVSDWSAILRLLMCELEDLYNRGLSWTGNSGAFYLLLQKVKGQSTQIEEGQRLCKVCGRVHELTP
jgi:hypothetical protein